MITGTLPAGYLAAAAIFSVLSVCVYRRYFHPLAKVPGPALAAVTYLYAFFFNNVGGSRYYAQIEKLHRKYGTASELPLPVFDILPISGVFEQGPLSELRPMRFILLIQITTKRSITWDLNTPRALLSTAHLARTRLPLPPPATNFTVCVEQP
jgi:hypothetical protein